MVRKIEKEDCVFISKITTVSWNETYRGIVPNEFLDELFVNEEDRINRLINKYEEIKDNYLVLDIESKVVGFVKYGTSNEYENYGEIYALYILKEYQGYGYGRLLVNEAVKNIKKMGYKKMIIFCLDGNKTNDFYKHIGGICKGKRNFKLLNLPENVYFFEDI